MMNEQQQRAAIVAAARQWVRTPYHNCADILGVGVDCGMLIVRVFVDTGVVPPFDPRPYNPDWMLHRNEEKYLEFFTTRCVQVETPGPGDLILFRYGRSYSHGGIITETDPITVVHAYHAAGCVVEETLQQNPALTEKGRRPIYFSVWGED